MGTISVNQLNKVFKQYRSIKMRFREWMFLGFKTYHQLNWVLKDLNFTVSNGEAVGIIGMNGAGKSTLLKIITGTCKPTSGTVHIQGKISALLELGLGFHPEFTGRENVILAGQLLGHQRKELEQLIPDIQAFAEIGDHFDQPLRTYSSGMQVRLAFSLATCVHPEILIVDEALSVGDIYFQHKCFKRIRELQAQGTTLLFVSHDHGAVTALCDRAILLHNGKVAQEGSPQTVIDYYNALLADIAGQNTQQIQLASGNIQTISGNKKVTVTRLHLCNDKDEEINTLNVGEQVKLRVFAQAHQQIPDLTIGYQIKDHLGQTVFGTNTFHLAHELQNVQNNQLLAYEFSFAANLGPGTYSVSLALHAADTHIEGNFEWRDLALIFTVVNLDKQKFIGTSWLPPKLTQLSPILTQRNDVS